MATKPRVCDFLADKGFPTPLTYVCTWDAYVRYAQGDAQVIDDLGAELAAKLDSQKWYAVRSSANLEDGVDLSFAGQFKSVLDVQGVDEILKAVRFVWDTTQSPSIQAYLGAKRLWQPRSQDGSHHSGDGLREGIRCCVQQEPRHRSG